MRKVVIISFLAVCILSIFIHSPIMALKAGDRKQEKLKEKKDNISYSEGIYRYPQYNLDPQKEATVHYIIRKTRYKDGFFIGVKRDTLKTWITESDPD